MTLPALPAISSAEKSAAEFEKISEWGKRFAT